MRAAPDRPSPSPATTHPYFDAPFIALAHRGGTLLADNEGIENTVAAFANAVSLGYRWLETDVHATSDGVLVAFHDTHLDRVTDQRGAIAETPWATARAARILRPNGEAEGIPLMDELLESFPECRFNIDIKAPGAIEPLARLIEHHRAHDRVCVGSFHTRSIDAFRRRMGTRVATSVAPPGVARTAFSPVLPHRFRAHGQAFQVPIHHTVRGRRVSIVTERFVDRAHRMGQHVHVWTINERAEMERLIDLGVDGLVTDRPDVLKDVLSARGLW